MSPAGTLWPERVRAFAMMRELSPVWSVLSGVRMKRNVIASVILPWGVPMSVFFVMTAKPARLYAEAAASDASVFAVDASPDAADARPDAGPAVTSDANPDAADAGLIVPSDGEPSGSEPAEASLEAGPEAAVDMTDATDSASPGPMDAAAGGGKPAEGGGGGCSAMGKPADIGMGSSAELLIVAALLVGARLGARRRNRLAMDPVDGVTPAAKSMTLPRR
jgi:hypothetical protein